MVRLARVEYLGQTVVAAQLENGDYCDLSSVAKDVPSFFALSPLERQKVHDLIQSVGSSGNNDLFIPAAYCKLLAPLDKFQVNKFLGIGLNYIDHCKEQNAPIPKEPMVFSKFGSSIAGTGDVIPTDPSFVKKLDYEAELGVVIGKVVPRNATVEVARQCIGGFTVIHDVSARDWQLEKNGGQWLLGKTGDGYAPMGPVIVTIDEMPLEIAQNAGIKCRVNGETYQNSNTSNLVHKVDGIISFLSKFLTLHPGDVISTGTPPGVGRRWLVPGDVVECEIDGIGTIVNQVVLLDGASHSTTSGDKAIRSKL